MHCIDPFGLGSKPFWHVKDRDHVSVAHEHVHGEVQDLGVKSAKTRNSMVQHVIPRLHSVVLHGRCIETDSIAPKVPHLSNLELQVLFRCLFRHFVSFLYKFKKELIKISFDVDALQLWIQIFADEHEVWVHLESTILSQNHSHMVLLLRERVNFDDSAVFEQLRNRKRLVHFYAQLDQLKLPLGLSVSGNFTIIVAALQEADLAHLHIFKN